MRRDDDFPVHILAQTMGAENFADPRDLRIGDAFTIDRGATPSDGYCARVSRATGTR